MSIYSMTGYATAVDRADGWVVNVHARSVNHRGLDTRFSLPYSLSSSESALGKLVRERFHRGRVELRVELEADHSAAGGSLRFFDAAQFEAVVEELRELGISEGLIFANQLKLSDVLAFKHLFERSDGAEIDPENPAILSAVERALDELLRARLNEGEGIAQDLRAHLRELELNLGAMAELLPGEADAFRARLAQRVEEAVEAFGAGDLEPERLAHELAFYADRSDVGEELQRAGSHVERLKELLEPGADASAEAGQRAEPRGKTIDFYLQELIRECNTMGSKSNSARGTDLVIAMKATIERMREQAANVE